MRKQHKNITFDGSCYDYLMRNGKFTCGFNMPEALKGEQSFGLPPYAKRRSFLVDKYPACPKNWMRSEGKVKSFFVPVIEGKGIWLDLNENETHGHHVAVVISVQGVNPITGMPCKDAHLEQYIEKCPKHKIKFGPDRYCKKCDYKWPKQNYIASTATPTGLLWLDGFRSIEGTVRQYILTAEKMRGVASNVIGKDRVYAIGLSFFISKEKKPIEAITTTYINYNNYQTTTLPPYTVNWLTPFGSSSSSPSSTVSSCSSSEATPDDLGSEEDMNIGDVTRSLRSKCNNPKLSITTHHAFQIGATVYGKPQFFSPVHTATSWKKLEVGAGANISQSVFDDPEKLSFWHDEPEAIICVNYVTEEDCKKILEQGEINIEGHKEGFLQTVPVGNN